MLVLRLTVEPTAAEPASPLLQLEP